MISILVECTNYNTVYGILRVEDIDENTVQQKIYEIKNKFYEEGFDDWTIEDILSEFPDEWQWKFTCTDSKIEI